MTECPDLLADLSPVASAPASKKHRNAAEALPGKFVPSKALPRRSSVLPPLDQIFLEKLRSEDRTNMTKRLRIGLSRMLPDAIDLSSNSVTAGEWIQEPDGTLSCSLSITSEGATGVRVHLEDLRLPVGARIVVYSPGATNPAAPLKIDSQESDVWGPTVFASTAIIEVRVPAKARVGDVHLVVHEISHVYRSLKELMDPFTDCIDPIACHPDWLETASGVALIDFIDKGSEFLCTGCLLNDADPTSDIDYFLTAHHCIGTQKAASTMEAFWFYQAATCQGDPPDMFSVPQTLNGAFLLSTSAKSDFAFLRLRDQAPDGTTFLGWSTATPSVLDPLACIHHPDAIDKRISFGHYTGRFDPEFWEVEWTNGVTWEGSSGSPLLLPDHSVIGQLYGGDSACTNQAGLDYFGRFDKTYPFIKKWIDNGAFISKQGVYEGIFFEPGNASFESSGFVSFKLTDAGTFSGNVQLGSSHYAFKGVASDWSITSATSSTTISVPRANKPPLTLNVSIDYTRGATDLNGTVSDGNWVAQLLLNRIAFNAKTNPSPFLGNFTLVLPPGGSDPVQPQGYSYATMTLNASGLGKLTGSLADGTAFTEAAGISDSGDLPVYVSLYGGKGCLVGWLNITNSPESGPAGDLTWIKKPQTAKLYSSGFTNDTSAAGAPYQKPDSSASPIQSGPAIIVFSGAGLDVPITNGITISSTGKVSATGPNRVSITFNRGNGLFSGSAVVDTITRPVPVKGALLQSDNEGFGYFIGNNLSGGVTILPQ